MWDIQIRYGNELAFKSKSEVVPLLSIICLLNFMAYVCMIYEYLIPIKKVRSYTFEQSRVGKYTRRHFVFNAYITCNDTKS